MVTVAVYSTPASNSPSIRDGLQVIVAALAEPLGLVLTYVAFVEATAPVAGASTVTSTVLTEAICAKV